MRGLLALPVHSLLLSGSSWRWGFWWEEAGTNSFPNLKERKGLKHVHLKSRAQRRWVISFS